MITKETAERKVNAWMAIAAEEIHLIKKRWKLTSNRMFSRTLKMNTRTLAKLNPAKPDGSLRFESIAMIFARLRALIPVFFGKDAEKEEERRLTDALWRIQEAVAPIPQSINDFVSDVTGSTREIP